jgi:hypothetical protein
LHRQATIASRDKETMDAPEIDSMLLKGRQRTIR